LGDGFNIEIDAETGVIEAEFKTKLEEILNHEVLSGDSTGVTYCEAQIKLFFMKDRILNVLQIENKILLRFQDIAIY
jgi:hypothetical protein